MEAVSWGGGAVESGGVHYTPPPTPHRAMGVCVLGCGRGLGEGEDGEEPLTAPHVRVGRFGLLLVPRTAIKPTAAPAESLAPPPGALRFVSVSFKVHYRALLAAVLAPVRH